MTHDEEIKSLVGEMVSMVNSMRQYATDKSISHDVLCKCLIEDCTEFDRLLQILHDELGYSYWKIPAKFQQTK